jgi:hypothetical protein
LLCTESNSWLLSSRAVAPASRNTSDGSVRLRDLTVSAKVKRELGRRAGVDINREDRLKQEKTVIFLIRVI